MLVGGGGTARAVTSHYHKENYNTLERHICGTFVCECYEGEIYDESETFCSGVPDEPIERLGIPD